LARHFRVNETRDDPWFAALAPKPPPQKSKKAVSSILYSVPVHELELPVLIYHFLHSEGAMLVNAPPRHDKAKLG
jgi:hypothetical protein